jgi:hypothetical protein
VIGDALQENGTLRTIILDQNPLSRQGGCALLRAMKGAEWHGIERTIQCRECNFDSTMRLPPKAETAHTVRAGSREQLQRWRLTHSLQCCQCPSAAVPSRSCRTDGGGGFDPDSKVRCAVCGVRCAVCGVRCAVCGVRCAVWLRPQGDEASVVTMRPFDPQTPQGVWTCDLAQPYATQRNPPSSG